VNVYPILAALRRHKAAVILIVLQIALTLAIVANAFFIVGHTIERMSRTSGLDEDGLIFIWQKLPVVTGDAATIIEKIDAMQRADLQAIRDLPDVQDAAATSGFPLLQGDGDGDISLDADRKGKFVHAAYYYGDEHLRATFGARPIAGRDFYANEIQHGQGVPGSPVIIVSKPLADQLFPSGNALGQSVYQDGKLATIVGIVERLQTPNVDDSNWADNSVIEPLRVDVFWTGYVARARSGRTTEAMRGIYKALFALDPMRHMPRGAGIHSFAEQRAGMYDDERGVALLMGVICVILRGNRRAHHARAQSGCSADTGAPCFQCAAGRGDAVGLSIGFLISRVGLSIQIHRSTRRAGSQKTVIRDLLQWVDLDPSRSKQENV
jgi:putative ABC transport system permease protein